MNTPWFERSRRRYFLDFHIDDWNDEFLTRYDPEAFAEACLQSGATAATFMANTHTGLLSWPSKLGGRMHKGLSGRDMLKETIEALHRRGLDAVVYYVFVYVADYWNKFPESRSVKADGNAQRQRIETDIGPHRFATCCINDPGYRKQALGELAEICDNYDFEGVWPDMTFWPTVCYCENCRGRYLKETGEELPLILDWQSPAFVRFVNTRKRWLREFCQEVTDTVKSRKPGMKLAQQSITFCWDWMGGASAELADCWDWISADRYGERYDLSYTGKLFYALSSTKPYERLNCWNTPGIHEHVITKTEDELRQIAFSTLMNDGALTIIDQIDPVGTIHTRNYETMGKVFKEMQPYEPYLGGEPRHDVGIYYSLHSNFDQSLNGTCMTQVGSDYEYGKENYSSQAESCHMKCAANAAKTLVQNHIPYGVVTKKNLKELHQYQVMILSNVAMMDEAELAAFRDYVAKGGSLYVSKDTATITADGASNGDFLLSELFGVKALGHTKEITTYVSPTDAAAELYPAVFSRDFPPVVHDTQMRIECLNPDAAVLGTLTLPDVYPREDRHASILTTPPGRFTPQPALVENRYGKGRVIYSGALLEMETHQSQRQVFCNVIQRLKTRPFCVETNGPAAIEITRFDKPGEIFLHVLNHQAELPNIPVYDTEIRIPTNGKSIRRVSLLPDDTALESREAHGVLYITLPKLSNYALIRVNLV